MIYLASQSPRRRELLAQIGVDFSTVSVDVDETPRLDETPDALVQRLALAKAQAGLDALSHQTHADSLHSPYVVLGSDTIVVHQGDVLGKPNNVDEGLAMLKQLSGNAHQVMTAVALVSQKRSRCVINTSTVRFSNMTDAQMAAYWQLGESHDKAGAYGIQGAAAAMIECIDGSYSGVMGLPLYETAQLLAEFQEPIWQYPSKNN